MAQFHFVEDYERYVADLIREYPLEEAMTRAVGGAASFDTVGEIERNVMLYAGLTNGMSVIDLGCGSGRLAAALGKSMQIEYIGLDIVQQLLDYAATVTPTNYNYILNHALTLPSADDSSDFLASFSVFTHLLHSETYLYLEDARRALKHGGKVVFSFLEFSNPDHWGSFEGEVATRRMGNGGHLNTMIERDVVKRWAEKLGYTNLEIVDGHDAPWGGSAMWQSVAIMQKP